MAGVCGEVAGLFRVVGMVVKLGPFLALVPLGVPPAVGADAAALPLAADDLGKRGGLAGARRVGEDGRRRAGPSCQCSLISTSCDFAARLMRSLTVVTRRRPGFPIAS